MEPVKRGDWVQFTMDNGLVWVGYVADLAVGAALIRYLPLSGSLVCDRWFFLAENKVKTLQLS